MQKRERARIVLEELERAYPAPGCPLHHTDPFTLLVAVMLSAQCTDARVNKVTPALFAAAPTPEAMAAMEWQEVREYIATCGLTQTKAKRLVQTARMLVEHHAGQVPATFAELEALPGVGHKTASVVMAQVFGMPAFPVDTHIFRLARRWGLSRGSTVEKVEADLKKIFPKPLWNKLHVQFVLWGREHCPARGCKPTCRICSQLPIA
ncbi:MAG: endonuclease III [Akkermansiaceae bacterium]|nr:endonuclease III [Akkermansiaceae bacterium]